MKSTQLHSPTVPRLRRALARAGISQKQVAAEAGVSKFMVSHVLAGRAKSARVVGIVRRLIEEAKSQQVAS